MTDHRPRNSISLPHAFVILNAGICAAPSSELILARAKGLLALPGRLVPTRRRRPPNNTESFGYIECLCGGMWNAEVKVRMLMGYMAGDVLIMCRRSRRCECRLCRAIPDGSTSRPQTPTASTIGVKLTRCDSWFSNNCPAFCNLTEATSRCHGFSIPCWRARPFTSYNNPALDIRLLVLPMISAAPASCQSMTMRIASRRSLSMMGSKSGRQ